MRASTRIGAMASPAADFEGDGDLDMVTGSSMARSARPWTERDVHPYENQLGGSCVALSDLPVGTMGTVESGGLTQTAEVASGYGHFGIQNERPLPSDSAKAACSTASPPSFPAARHGSGTISAATTCSTCTTSRMRQ